MKAESSKEAVMVFTKKELEAIQSRCDVSSYKDGSRALISAIIKIEKQLASLAGAR